MTCERYPGIRGHELYDADTLASWETDYLKLDGCFADVEGMSKGYPAFGRILNATGRPILYACSWPFFQETNGIRVSRLCIIKKSRHRLNFLCWKMVCLYRKYYGLNQSFIFCFFSQTTAQ